MMTAVGNVFRLPQIPLLTITALLILGVIVPAGWSILGFLNGNQLSDIVNDANGHVFYLLGFALLLGYRFEPRVLMTYTMFLVLVLCVVCLLVYVYALLGLDQANQIKKLLREGDYGFLNVFVDGRPYRLFLSSFLFIPIMVCFGLQRIIVQKRETGMTDVTGLVFVTVGLGMMLIAQTRSLWLGLIVGVLVILLASFWRLSPRWVLSVGVISLLGVYARCGSWLLQERPNLGGPLRQSRGNPDDTGSRQ